MTTKSISFVLVLTFVFISSFAQPSRWQQRVKYAMNIDVDASTNKFTGKQKLEYTNNSPDVLNKVFYHLYFIQLKIKHVQNMVYSASFFQ